MHKKEVRKTRTSNKMKHEDRGRSRTHRHLHRRSPFYFTAVPSLLGGERTWMRRATVVSTVAKGGRKGLRRT
jgi:hypothetical protein